MTTQPTGLLSDLSYEEVQILNMVLADLERLALQAEIEAGIDVTKLTGAELIDQQQDRLGQMINAMHDILCEEIHENAVNRSTILRATGLGILCARYMHLPGVATKTSQVTHHLPPGVH